ncbi:bifunctional phosphoribosyl-AMP cyclohydrolase/phosphoribosyl-ATP diphosphatase HisIE [Legionella rowbothamii]|uniref:bifunctional phosphoribosyl-AMP cyclohydrolase/phosphoribosyl-ATP diphosphatase HisIE n=1 Tax=Legionella rowbothamii TaxID=96229 RepID=UPI001055C95E|nr:bifunctional phosphoribosyl-AMP cyclohydrolase/phosphoribosyl-ATP diphosphatase HisIE [Legionella rowbothamii]
MNQLEISALDWQKMNGLLPAIIQNAETGTVLMLGYMSEEALIATVTTGQLTLYSRSRKRLWRKGETSGNTMSVQQISTDCDSDSLLILVLPKGPACHLGFSSCYQPDCNSALGFMGELIDIINERAETQDENSYTAKLLDSGINRCAQKVGEEAVETVIAAVNQDNEEFINESADLIFHLLVLLKASELSFYDVLECLKKRDRAVHT